jgi:hypothetical protein
MSDAISQWTRRGLGRAAVIAAVAVGTGAGLGYLVAHEPKPKEAASHASSQAAPVAPPEERAMVEPLTVGAKLEDFDVVEIRPIGDDGLLRMACRKGNATVRLQVGLVAEDGPPPPAVAGPYAIYYGGESAVGDEGERLALALAKVIGARNASPPSKLKAFVPRSHPRP